LRARRARAEAAGGKKIAAPAQSSGDLADPLNRNSYNAIAASWDEARRSLSARERPYLDAFLADLQVPSHILDLGCGTGRPMAEHILAEGHRVTGVDQAERLLDLARSRFPAARWIESRIEHYAPAEHYAGVVCWDALFHIERVHHETVIRRIARWLEPGGKLMLTFGGSEHAAFTDTMFGQTFFYDSRAPEKELSILREAGFKPLVADFIDPPTTGRDKGRYAVVARRD
jgi:2-polyprenyl-3-methyl-5-hydroxy-6-metoxy-1,4-benzoquinol methylase